VVSVMTRRLARSLACPSCCRVALAAQSGVHFASELIVCVSRSHACCESLLLMWGMHFLVSCVVQSLTFWVRGRRNLPKKFRKFLRESKHGGSVHATLAGRSVSV